MLPADHGHEVGPSPEAEKTPLEPDDIVKRVKETRSANMFGDIDSSRLPGDDLNFVLDIDRFQFVLKVEKRDGLLYLVRED